MSLKGVSSSFAARADSAAFYEAWVAAVLSRGGLYTLHHPFEIDPTRDFSQTWDLDVTHFPPDPPLKPDCKDVRLVTSSLFIPVEVKSVSLTFYNTDSYPFENVLVCSQSSWLKKWPGKDTVQRNFLLVSRPTGSILWIPKGTPVTLGHDVLDRSRNELYKAVQTTKGHLRPLADFVDAVKDGSA